MAKIDDLPVELVEFITDYLSRASDLAALARTSHKFHDSVDPILYKFARGNISNLAPWHPLRWAARTGRTGTLEKALAAGIDVNMAFARADSTELHDWDTFGDEEETVDNPRLESHREWEPHEDDTDLDDMSSSPSTDDRIRPGYPPLPTRHPHGHSEDDWDDYDFFDAMDDFHAGAETDSTSGDDSIAEAAAAAFFNAFPDHPALADDEIDDDDAGLDEDSEDDLHEFSQQDTDSIERSVRRTVEGAHDSEDTFRALHLAARGGNDEAVSILLDHGASIDVCSSQLGRLIHLRSPVSHEQFGTSQLPAEAGYSPLHLAICHSHTSTARLLLSRGASPQLSEPRRKDALTALHAAAATGQVDLCKHLLDGGFVEVDAPDQTGLTPFYYAFRSWQWSSTVPLLLERGADINFLIRRSPSAEVGGNGERCTAFYESCAFGRFSEAKRLIFLGVDVNKGLFARDAQCRSPLHAICESLEAWHLESRSSPAAIKDDEVGRVELIKLMLKLGAELEATSRPAGESPLHIAARNRDVAALRVLLDEGADVESQDSDGRTALFSACGRKVSRGYTFPGLHLRRGSEIDVINMLMDHGANLNAKDKAGDTVIHLVCSKHHDLSANDQDRILRRLLQRGAKGDIPNRLEITPFETAFHAEFLGLCDVLVRHGHVPRNPKQLERMMLDLVPGRAYHLPALDLLLDLDVSGCLFSKSIYLMKMIDGGHVRVASRYLERCPTRFPHLSPKEKLTTLREALALDNEELVKHMLAMKVSVNVPDKNGHTPLYVAVQQNKSGRSEVVRALLESGSDIHFRPPSSTIRTPLEKAIMEEKYYLVEIMLQHQPLRDSPKAPKGVYLHTAARGAPSKRLFSILIRSGASVTELDGNNDTPLSVFLKSIADLPNWAAHTRPAGNRVCGTVWRLWNNKVDINLRNKSGKAITSYLAALRMYDGDNPARKRIAEELRLGLDIVPADGADGEKGLKTLRFRHSLMGLGNFHGGPKQPNHYS